MGGGSKWLYYSISVRIPSPSAQNLTFANCSFAIVLVNVLPASAACTWQTFAKSVRRCLLMRSSAVETKAFMHLGRNARNALTSKKIYGKHFVQWSIVLVATAAIDVDNHHYTSFVLGAFRIFCREITLWSSHSRWHSRVTFWKKKKKKKKKPDKNLSIWEDDASNLSIALISFSS